MRLSKGFESGFNIGEHTYFCACLLINLCGAHRVSWRTAYV
jgi:hypothetical protein